MSVGCYDTRIPGMAGQPDCYGETLEVAGPGNSSCAHYATGAPVKCAKTSQAHRGGNVHLQPKKDRNTKRTPERPTPAQ